MHFELKRFKNSNDKNLIKALTIYSQNIELQLRTDTNEIIYWLDNYNSTFSDKFYLFGLYLDDVIIGFAQLVFFVNDKFVFADYIVIEKNARKNNTFYQFVEEIKEFFISERIEYNYIIGEVGYFDENKEPTEMTRNLVRLLKMAGFGVVKVDYFQPMLGKNNYESELMSVLMMYPNELKIIKKETFLVLIDTIYFSHYKRWYDRFFNELEQAKYSDRLNSLKNKLETNIKAKKYIEINGYATLFKSDTTSTRPKSYVRLSKIVAFIATFILITIVIGVIVVFLKKKYNVDNDTIKFVSIGAGIMLLFSLNYYYKKDDEPVTELIEKVIKIFKK